MLFVLTSCDRAVVKNPVQKLVRGEVIEVTSSALAVHPIGRSSKDAPTRQIVTIDAGTRVTAPYITLDDKTGRLVTTPIPAHLSDLRPGDRVSISTRDGVAVSIKVAPALPVQGEVVRWTTGSLTVKQSSPRMAKTADQTFPIEEGRTTVAAQKLNSSTFEPRHLSDLQPGQYVSVVAVGGVAELIGLVPPPPIHGHVTQIDTNSIAISPSTRPGEQAQSDRRFALDPSRTVFFDLYLGLPTERIGFSDITAGQVVEVVAKDGQAQSVTIVHSPIHRKLIAIDAGSMTVNRNAATPNKQFRLLPTTHVLVARVTNTFKAPNGKDGYGYTYVDAKQADLKPGDDLSITAKGQVALEVHRAFQPNQFKGGSR